MERNIGARDEGVASEVTRQWLYNGTKIQWSRHNAAGGPKRPRSSFLVPRPALKALNLQQLRYLAAVVDHGLNVSDAAEALFTSQPGISKQIRQLEDELGIEVFVRQGKRLAQLTPAGTIVVATARRALTEIANLKRVADEFRREDEGELAIATTHTQARYVLPNVLKAFAARYPKVRLV